MSNKKIVDYINIDAMSLNLKSKNKRDIIKELLENINKTGKVMNYDVVLSDLYTREDLGTTGIGKNVALPHAKTEGVNELIIGLGISKEGIDYASIDEEKANIFFMFLSPAGETQEYLKILAKISRLIREDEFRKKILNAKSETELFDIILNVE